MSVVPSLTVTALVGACCMLAQLSTVLAQTVFSCRGRGEGLFTNPSDCSGYYQCANGLDLPYARSCAPGSLFDDIQRACLAASDVFCNGRPLNNNFSNPPSTYQPLPNQPFQPIPTQTFQPIPTQPFQPIPSRPFQPIPTQPFQPAPTQPWPTLLQGINTNNRVSLRLSNGLNGPQLRSDQCSEVGRLLGRYVQYLANGYDPSCAGNSNCQQSLPTFQVECLTNTGRFQG